MKTKYLIVLVLGFLLIMTTGCEKQKESNNKQDSSTKIHEHCVRTATLSGGEANLSYELYYTGERLNKLESQETVISSDSNLLDTYEDAYKKIHENYKNLKYYDANVIRNDTSVTSKIVIDYDKINIEQLLQIEGAEDNIVEDGIPKVEKWKELAKKFGASCTPVTNS